MMRALLCAQGVTVTQARVREVLTRTSPTSAASRCSQTVARRVYHVPYPNSFWHIDGNMQLISPGSSSSERTYSSTKKPENRPDQEPADCPRVLNPHQLLANPAHPSTTSLATAPKALS
ncbi:hypothetical protein ATANTOWER_016409 [Ataeniobius toweri]|uniref:Integrase core domain-containing protein n=1 Tax=Ataeniobius toweri TaxID=208326 RepID=A0ABU7C8K0_9TELE|nr:hypothetical protein [Ataeniobius toweri]